MVEKSKETEAISSLRMFFSKQVLSHKAYKALWWNSTSKAHTKKSAKVQRAYPNRLVYYHDFKMHQVED